MISPFESLITFSGAVTASVYILSYSTEKDKEFFQRLEFSNKLLQEALEIDGAIPQSVTSATGQRYFRDITCDTDPTPRSNLTDDALLDSINQKFEIQRYNIGGATSNVTDVDAIDALFDEHLRRRTRFEAHLNEVRNYVSVTHLEEMQDETFSYLTTTNLTMTGNVTQNVAKNHLLIRRYVPDVDFEYDDGSGNLVLYKTFTMTLERLTIKPASSVT